MGEGSVEEPEREPEPVLLDNCILGSLGYADDLCFLAHSVSDLQKKFSALEGYCKEWGLTVNLKKTKILRLSALALGQSAGRVMYGGREVEWTSEYKYLGCVFVEGGCLNKTIESRIASASRALGGVIGLIASMGPLSIDAQVTVFRACWTPVALYCLECLPVRDADLLALDALQLRFARNHGKTVLVLTFRGTISTTDAMLENFIESSGKGTFAFTVPDADAFDLGETYTLTVTVCGGDPQILDPFPIANGTANAMMTGGDFDIPDLPPIPSI
uniref:Reverse transcriptase domain-containing protein n=1 Tax=Chromera velia CCMP2878 TaxID=1169474 RepID=A0A0G4HRQ7_9ALVE